MGVNVILSQLRGEYEVTVRQPSWDDLLNGAVALYWRRREDVVAARREAMRGQLRRDANRVRMRQKRGGGGWTPNVCPSPAGYERHRRRHEDAERCGCAQARREYDHAARVTARGPDRPEEPTMPTERPSNSYDPRLLARARTFDRSGGYVSEFAERAGCSWRTARAHLGRARYLDALALSRKVVAGKLTHADTLDLPPFA